jgi:hypothetical protein
MLAINLLDIGIEKSTTKAIALVDNKIDHMLQRQIVKALDKQIKDLVYSKYAITRFHSLALVFISVIVIINRTVPLSQRYQSSSSSHCIMMMTDLILFHFIRNNFLI